MRTFVEGAAAWLTRTGGVLITLAGLSMLAPGAALLVLGTDSTLARSVSILVIECGLGFVIAGALVAYLARTGAALLLPNERATPVAGSARTPLGGWLILFAIALVAMPLVLGILMQPFVTECVRVVRLLTEAGMWKAAGAQMGGIVLMPVLIAMTPPAIEIVGALTFVKTSILALVLLSMTSVRLPRLYLAWIVIQAVFVLAGVLATQSVATLREPLEQEIARLGPSSPESVEFLAQLDKYVTMISSTSMTLAWTLAGYLIWAPMLLGSARARTTFAPRPQTTVTASGKPDVATVTRRPHGT